MTHDTPRLITLDTAREPFLARYCDRWDAQRNGRPLGPVVPWPNLRDILGGCWPAGTAVLHAEPGAGKTAFGLQAADECGCPAVVLTTEMPPDELIRRVVARRCACSVNRLRRGTYTPDEVAGFYATAAARSPNLAILDGTTSWISSTALEESAIGVRGDNPHLLIVLDSLHTWAAGAGEGATEYERLGLAIPAVGQIARRLQCSILIIAERNRAAMASGGLSAAAGHRSFEFGAEVVLGLQTPDGVPANGQRNVTVDIAKNRNGPKDEVALHFHEERQRFTEVANGPRRFAAA